MTSSDYTNYLVKIADSQTSTYPAFNPSIIQNSSFILPPFVEQQAIARVLLSLDDKIELLREQNKTLEDITQEIFKEWFVKSNKFTKKRLFELIKFNPREILNKEMDSLFFDMKCLSENSIVISEGSRKKVSSATSFREGDTLMAKITPCLENGKTGYVFDLKGESVARGSTEFIVMRATNKVNPFFVYALARSEDFREYAIKSMTGTSGRQRVQIEVLKNYEMEYSEDLMNKYSDFCTPLFMKIKNNIIQSNALSTLRDTLLPKLIRGELKVTL